ncbi:hypothetical protein AMC99_02145 [Altererythrobacter epoxidivorans]|uniref:Uncharacterized protein n=1 Tax=Altererythrobacter epoxidivorans TaxID=361183 RepID=A0A0M4MX33_9SPHN|nr:hypothetical protein AMC99_02145 [Altererythrobacter epoxidivorans]
MGGTYVSSNTNRRIRITHCDCHHGKRAAGDPEQVAGAKHGA